MIAFLGFTAAVLLVLLLAPDSASGKLLHRSLVERPLRLLASFELRHVIFIAVMGGFMLAGGEILLLAGPELVTGFAIELSIYLDAVIVTYALSTLAMAKRGGGWLRQSVIARLPKGRPRRKRSARRRTPPRRSANDDDPAADRLAA